MTTEKHTILNGKVHVYRRPNSPNWQCSAFLNGKNDLLPIESAVLG